MAGVINTITANRTTHPLASTVFAVCQTAANVPAKVAISQNKVPIITGLTVPVYFVYGNTAENITLQIATNDSNNTVYPIYRYGSLTPGTTIQTSWHAGSVISFTFNGSAWIMNNYSDGNTDTLNTAGSLNTSNKIYLIGAQDQQSSIQTYSNLNTYSQNGKLYSNSKQVVTLSDTQDLTNKTFNGYSLGDAAFRNIDTEIEAPISSLNLPTSQAVSLYVDEKILESSGTVTQSNTVTSNEYRILLSYSASDITQKNIISKNSNFRYNPNLKTMLLDNINELQPLNSLTTALKPGQLILQKGEEPQQQGDYTLEKEVIYDINGLDITKYSNIQNPLQPGQSEPTYTIETTNTTITAEQIYSDGDLSIFGQTNINNTLLNTEEGLISIGQLNSQNSIKFINSSYIPSVSIPQDLKGITIGNDGILTEDNYSSKWTGYNINQLSFNYTDRNIVASADTPYNFPTSKSQLDNEKIIFLTGDNTYKAEQDQANYKSQLNSQYLSFTTITREIIPGQPGQQDIVIQTTDTQSITKQSIKNWNQGIRNRFEFFDFSHTPYNAETYTIPIFSLGYYRLIIMNPSNYMNDRIYYIAVSSVSGETYNSHVTKVLSSTNENTHNNGNIDQQAVINVYNDQDKVANFSFRCNSSFTSPSFKVILETLWSQEW